MSDFNVLIKKDVSFLHVINDIEKFITETSTKLNLETSLKNISRYPAFITTGSIENEEIYYPTKLANTRNITLTGGATGTATFNGTADASIAVTIDPTQHVHSKPYIVTSITITPNSWFEEVNGSNYNYTKVFEVANALSSDIIIPQLNLSGLAFGTAQTTAMTDYAKLRRFVPTNGYITVHAAEVPITTVSVDLIRLR